MTPAIEKNPFGISCPDAIGIQYALFLITSKLFKGDCTSENIEKGITSLIEGLYKNPEIDIFTVNNASGRSTPFDRDLLRSQYTRDFFRNGIIPDFTKNTFNRPFQIFDAIFVNEIHFQNFIDGKPIIATAPDAHKMPEYIPAYMQFMLEAVKALELSEDKYVVKKTVENWLKDNWPDDIPYSSDKLLGYMATLIRRPRDAEGTKAAKESRKTKKN